MQKNKANESDLGNESTRASCIWQQRAGTVDYITELSSVVISPTWPSELLASCTLRNFLKFLSDQQIMAGDEGDFILELYFLPNNIHKMSHKYMFFYTIPLYLKIFIIHISLLQIEIISDFARKNISSILKMCSQLAIK